MSFRILFPFVGDTVGGSHMSAITLACGLLQANHVTPIIALHRHGPLSDYLADLGIDFVFFPNIELVQSGSLIQQLKNMFRTYKPLARFLMDNQIDVVHTNDQKMHLTWLLATKITGCKHIWHQRNICPSFRVGLYSLLASRVVTISKFCLNNMSKPMADKAQIINNPISMRNAEIDKHICRKKLHHDLAIDMNVILIGWVANWIERKRPLDFIDLASEVSARYPENYRFLMLGEARAPLNEKVLEYIATKKLMDRVIVMGSRSPIEPYIAGCDVLVATAENEGLGRTLIEAMLLGTPVVATADGGHLEVITDMVDGRLVPVGDTAAMACAVLDVLRDKEQTKKMVMLAKEKATSEYAVDRHVESIISLYQSL